MTQPDTFARPNAAQMTRRVLVLVSALFSILVAYSQVSMGWGQSQAEFAAEGDSTLRVAAYAFSIWGLIYIGLLIYAVRQLLPRTGESQLINRLGWPSVVAFVGIGGWIVAAAYDWRWMTVILIFMAWLALLLPLLSLASTIRALPLMHADRTTVVWPLAALAGWLTAAAPLNLVGVLTSEQLLPLPPTTMALIAVGVIAGIGIGVTARLRTLAFPLPIAWALVGAYVAEQTRNPSVAYAALVAAIAVLILSVVLVLRRRP